MSPRQNWDSLASECASPPEPKGRGGGTVACGRGGGVVPIPTTGENLSTLPTLWHGVMSITCCL